MNHSDPIKNQVFKRLCDEISSLTEQLSTEHAYQQCLAYKASIAQALKKRAADLAEYDQWEAEEHLLQTMQQQSRHEQELLDSDLLKNQRMLEFIQRDLTAF